MSGGEVGEQPDATTVRTRIDDSLDRGNRGETDDESDDDTNNNGVDIDDTNYRLELEVATSQDMEDVGAVLSVGTVGGDTLLLGGDLGAGKTCLSRGFVRARTGCGDIRVTSPTYLLSNTYPADGEDVMYVPFLFCTVYNRTLCLLSCIDIDIDIDLVWNLWNNVPT